MSLRRSNRNTAKVDYSRLNSLGTTAMENSEFSVHSEENGEFEDLDPEMLQEIVEQEAADLRDMEAQLAQIQQEEAIRKQEKKKKLLEQLESLQAIKEKKALIQRALSRETGGASNPVTPRTSPVQQSQQTSVSAGGDSGQAKFNDLFNSVFQLRNGNVAPFVNLMQNKTPKIDKVTSARKINFDSNVTVFTPASTTNDTVAQLPSQTSTSVQETKPVTSALKGETSEPKPGSAVVTDVPIVNNIKTECDCVSENGSDEEFKQVKGKRKRKSGILTNPNESEIVLTLRYPHELLDDRHVRTADKVFNKLPFNLFCAGELELIRLFPNFP